MLLTPHMTTPQGEELAAMQAMSFPGMAHWAGSGPSERTCRECCFWSSPWSKFDRDKNGQLSERKCEKFPRLAQGKDGQPIPHSAGACKYCEQSESPAPIDGRNSVSAADTLTWRRIDQGEWILESKTGLWSALIFADVDREGQWRARITNDGAEQLINAAAKSVVGAKSACERALRALTPIFHLCSIKDGERLRKPAPIKPEKSAP